MNVGELKEELARVPDWPEVRVLVMEGGTAIGEWRVVEVQTHDGTSKFVLEAE